MPQRITESAIERTLQNMFRMVGAGDRQGFGVRKIIEGWKAYDWRVPHFEELDEPSPRVLVTLSMFQTAPTPKDVFDQFYKNKAAIEDRFGGSLEWLRLDDKKSSRIQFSEAFEGYNEDNWKIMIEWLVENFPKLEAAFRPEIEKVKRSRQDLET